MPAIGEEKPITDGILGEEKVLYGIENAKNRITKESPDRIITIGGNCIVSLAPSDSYKIS